MVQVDVFWSYGLGAGLALAEAGEIRKSASPFRTEAFIWTLIWIGAIFAPSGLYLLWTNPAWETMFVARDYSSLPPWLVMLFAATNLTQGILGFWITARAIQAGRMRRAIWQPLWSHLALLFILVFGWNGHGYERFFYAGTGAEWHAGVSYPLAAFFQSEIFFALLKLGVLFIPTYVYLCLKLRKTEPAHSLATA
jgi:hypothetical protein